MTTALSKPCRLFFVAISVLQIGCGKSEDPYNTLLKQMVGKWDRVNYDNYIVIKPDGEVEELVKKTHKINPGGTGDLTLVDHHTMKLRFSNGWSWDLRKAGDDFIAVREWGFDGNRWGGGLVLERVRSDTSATAPSPVTSKNPLVKTKKPPVATKPSFVDKSAWLQDDDEQRLSQVYVEIDNVAVGSDHALNVYGGNGRNDAFVGKKCCSGQRWNLQVPGRLSNLFLGPTKMLTVDASGKVFMSSLGDAQQLFTLTKNADGGSFKLRCGEGFLSTAPTEGQQDIRVFLSQADLGENSDWRLVPTAQKLDGSREPQEPSS